MIAYSQFLFLSHSGFKTDYIMRRLYLESTSQSGESSALPDREEMWANKHSPSAMVLSPFGPLGAQALGAGLGVSESYTPKPKALKACD